MPEPNQFRHYQIVQDAGGNNVELVRNSEQVAVLVFDARRLEFSQCHVLLQPPASAEIFGDACRKLRCHGHPLMARMVDYGEDEGNAFYITSNIDGETLRAYLSRQQEIPVWLAVMIACRALETASAVCERGDFLSDQPLETFRVVQTGQQVLQVMAADFRVIDGSSARMAKNRALKANFDRQGKFLRTFLQEQSGGGPTLQDTMLHAADFAELLGACLATGGPAVITPMLELRNALLKLAPEHLSGEIPSAQKPRALVAPLLATYQEVARGLVNLVRIQSQRLDMTNPYSMRGTLAKTGRPVLVEEIPPSRICGTRVLDVDKQMTKLSRKRDAGSLVTLALVNETESINCIAEEVVEGVQIADLLRERGSLSVHEAYLVLAGLDSALQQIEKSELPVRKLRLEDLYLLTGFARDDARTQKLLSARLNEWPSFSIAVRSHPSLSSMAGRGTDPAVLYPPATFGAASDPSPWHSGWLAATGRFLLGLELLPGVSTAKPDNSGGGARERETVARLLDDELTKARDGSPGGRADFLARYARVVHHYDLVKPTPTPAPAPKTPVEETVSISKILPKSGKSGKTTSARVGKKKSETVAALELNPAPLGIGALTAPVETGEDESTVGFAEILFQSAGSPSPPPEPSWVKEPAPGVPAQPAAWVDQPDGVPFWLKAAVFLGASMLAGGILAHLSGEAVWQKSLQQRQSRQMEAPAPVVPATAGSGMGDTTTAAASNASATLPPATAPDRPSTDKPVPKAVPIDSPDKPANLSLSPPTTSLKELMAEQNQGGTSPAR